MSTEQYKAQGNAFFAAKDFPQAIESFTKAIEASPEPNHVLYSNRSAAYASLKQFDPALKDAEKCVSINPAWAKGYNRVAAARFGLGDLEGAKADYAKSVEIDQNAMAKEGLTAVEAAIKQRDSPPDMGLGAIFSDPNMIQKLQANPKTAELMKDPALAAKVAMMQSNPSANVGQLMSDPRLMTIMAALMGIDMDAPPPAPEAAPEGTSNALAAQADVEMKDAVPETAAPATKSEPTETEAKSAEKETQSSETDSAKLEADAAKAEGNALYKAHKFDEAIAAYDKAWSLCKDITYLNNRAAAEFEKGDYDASIESCNKAIDEGREVRADYKIIAKSFARIGNCYLKKDDLANAAKFFDKSLTEHRTPDVLNKLRATQREIKKREAESYIDPAKAEEARLEGKEYFTKSDWPGAVRAYSEMIKRAPEDARGYSNRAAALMKLLSFPDAVRDCTTAIEKDPDFIRAYIRKANAQVAMKDYSQALETINDARDKDITLGGKNLAEIDQVYSRAMSQRFENIEGETPEQTMERVGRDPEIVSILQDPVMQGILQQARDNPEALQEHMKNPNISKKINMLVAAGVIRTR